MKFPWQFKLAIIAFPLLCLGALTFLYANVENTKDILLQLIGLPVCTLFGVGFFLWLSQKRKKESIRILSHSMNSFQRGIGMREVEFTDMEIIAKSSSDEMEITWSSISSILNKKEFYFFRSSSKGIYIPKRELTTDEISAVNKLIYKYQPRKDY